MMSLIWCTKLRVWFARAKYWIGAALALVVAYFALRRRLPPVSKPSDSKVIADAVRPGLKRIADRARLERESDLRAAEVAHEEAVEQYRAVEAASDEESIRMFREYEKRRKAGPILAVLLLCWPVVGQAQDIPCSKSPGNEACALAHPRTHAPGVWLNMPAFKLVLADALALPLCQARGSRLLAANRAADVELDALRATSIMDERALEATGAALEAEHAARLREQAWYRSPWLWGPAGAFLGVVMMGTLAIAVGS